MNGISDDPPQFVLIPGERRVAGAGLSEQWRLALSQVRDFLIVSGYQRVEEEQGFVLWQRPGSPAHEIAADTLGSRQGGGAP